jgi:hypothetical protein
MTHGSTNGATPSRPHSPQCVPLWNGLQQADWEGAVDCAVAGLGPFNKRNRCES